MKLEAQNEWPHQWDTTTEQTKQKRKKYNSSTLNEHEFQAKYRKLKGGTKKHEQN